MTNLTDIATRPLIDLWGDTVKGRRIEGERITFAVIELTADAIVPEHRHENEQLGMVIAGSVTFTVGDETRDLVPGGTWRIPSDVPHQVTAGPTGAIVIDVFAPPRRDWDDRPTHDDVAPNWP